MYHFPPLMLLVHGVTNAVAGVANAGDFLPAPGAGFAYRIVAFYLDPELTTVGDRKSVV
jgi:hypothetical protein